MSVPGVCAHGTASAHTGTFEKQETYQWYVGGTSQRKHYYAREVHVTAVVCPLCISENRRKDIRTVIICAGVSLLLPVVAVLLYLALGLGSDSQQFVLVTIPLGIIGFAATAVMAIVRFGRGQKGRVNDILRRQIGLRQKNGLCEVCGCAPSMQIVLSPRQEDVDQTELTQLGASAAVNLSPRVVGYRCAQHTAFVPSPFSLQPLAR